MQNCLLEAMQPVVCHQAFDRGDLSSLRLCRQIGARVDRLPIEQHHARATLAIITAFFCAGQTNIVTEHTQQIAIRAEQGILGFLQMINRFVYLGYRGLKQA